MKPEYTAPQQFKWRGDLYDVEFMALTVHTWLWHNADYFAQNCHRPDLIPPHSVMAGVVSAFREAGCNSRANALYAEYYQTMGISDHPKNDMLH